MVTINTLQYVIVVFPNHTHLLFNACASREVRAGKAQVSLFNDVQSMEVDIKLMPKFRHLAPLEDS